MWLDKLSIPRKLTLAFAITLASSAISSGFIFKEVMERERSSEQSNAIQLQQMQALSATSAHLDMAQTVRGYLLTGVDRHKKLYLAAGVKFDEEIGKAIAPAETEAGNPQVVAALRGMQAASHEWRSEIGDRIIKLVDETAGREKATEIAMSTRSSQMQQKFRDAQGEALNTLDLDSKRLDALEAAGQRHTLLALGFGGGIAFLAALASAFVLSRNIARPLGQLAAQIGELARGTTSVVFAGKCRRDDIGLIAGACESFREAILSGSGSSGRPASRATAWTRSGSSPRTSASWR